VRRDWTRDRDRGVGGGGKEGEHRRPKTERSRAEGSGGTVCVWMVEWVDWGVTPPILISIPGPPPTGLSRGVMEINIAEL